MAEHFMKLEKGNKSIIDLNMDLNELFRETFGEPILEMSLSFEQTMESFLERPITS